MKPTYRMKLWMELWMVWVGLALWIGLSGFIVWLVQR